VKGDGINHAQITHQLQMPHIVLVVDSVRHHHLRACACMGISTRRGYVFGGEVNCKYHTLSSSLALCGTTTCVCVCMYISTIGGYFGGAGSTPNIACCPHRWLCVAPPPVHCVCVHRGGGRGRGVEFGDSPKRKKSEDRKSNPPSCNLSFLSEFFLPPLMQLVVSV